MRFVSLLVLAVVALALPSGDALGGKKKKSEEHDATVHQRFDDVEAWVKKFEEPDRHTWQKPGDLLMLLSLREGDTIADLGTGTGYFVPTLSAAVGETGHVYAVDIEQSLVDYVAARTDMPFPNVETILAAPDDPRLPAGKMDAVLIVNTWHHIDKRLQYLDRLKPALVPSGRIVIVDWHEGELPKGPPAGKKLARDKVIKELKKAGWALTAETVALPYQYVLVFMPAEHAVPKPLL